MMLKTLPLAKLVLDFEDLYPRASVDSTHVTHLAEAMELGVDLPPIVIDEKTMLVVDGFHRFHAHKRLKRPTISCEVRDYQDRREMFLDAMRLNGTHGRMMSNFDRAHCIIMAAKHKIEPDQIAAALSISISKIGELRSDRVGQLRSAGNSSIPLKRTIHHLAGHTLTKSQYEAQDKLGGMDQLFYVNQIVVLLESNLIDRNNERLMARLAHLGDLIGREQRRSA